MQQLTKRPLFSLLQYKHSDFDRWFASKVIVLDGDLTKPMCGLSKADYATLLDEVSYVIHSAASTSFSDPLTTMLQHNYWVRASFPGIVHS